MAVQPGQQRARLDAVDGVRAVACLMVVVYHSWEFAGSTVGTPWLTHFPVGVDLFIVLSGFCLFLPVARRSDRFRSSEFLRNRCRRIVPAYYAAIVYAVALPQVLVVAWRVTGHAAQWRELPSAFQLFTHLTFTHTLFPSTWAGINGAFWSLGLEAQFYALMPVVVLLYRKMGLSGLAVPVAISLGWNLAVLALYTSRPDASWVSGFLLGANVLGRWVEFGLGAMAAHLATRDAWRSQLPPRFACFLGAASVALIALDIRYLESALPFPALVTIRAFAGAALLVSLAAAPRSALARLLAWRPLRSPGSFMIGCVS